jgi:hypothetical protein
MGSDHSPIVMTIDLQKMKEKVTEKGIDDENKGGLIDLKID